MRLRLLLILLVGHLSLYAVRFTPEAKANCQMMDKEAGTVTLIFATDSLHFGLPKDSILNVWVSGSINDVQDMVDEYELNAYSEDSCYYRTFRWQQLQQPGNSGQPEFVFFVLKKDSSGANYYGYDHLQAKMDERLLFYNGIPYTLIILPDGPDYFTDDLNELARRGTEAKQIKSLAEFNLNDSVDQHHISNFRLAAGTKNLYRSYHPYYPSMAVYDSEVERLHWVQNLAEQEGIRSAISLTGSLTYTLDEKYVCAGDTYVVTMPTYYQSIINEGHVCDLGLSTTLCYFHADGAEFAQLMKQVVEFIIDDRHPMPMQIHCAIGADRTGVVCAMLSALCGADWESIMADYAATSNMKVQTYRHPNRLRYVFQCLKIQPDSCSTNQLRDAVRAHFVDTMQVLTNPQIERLTERLTQPLSTDIQSVESIRPRAEAYDVLGRLVDETYRGWVIQSGTLIFRP